jgi:phenylalanyl-tRNA synthetase beta subunit
MKGRSTHCIALDLLIKAKNKTISNDDIILMRDKVEQAIRDSFKAKLEFYESWTGVKK